MYVAFFILLGIFLILILPLKFNVDLNLNALKNRGFIKLKLFSIKFLYYKLKYKEKKIILSNVKTTKEINLEINKQNIDFMNELQTQLVKRLYLKNLKVYLNVGVKENPFASAMLGAGFEILLSILSSVVKFHKPTADVNYKICTYYEKNIGILNIDFAISISITNLIISLIKAKSIIKKKEQLKNESKGKFKSKSKSKASN